MPGAPPRSERSTGGNGSSQIQRCGGSACLTQGFSADALIRVDIGLRSVYSENNQKQGRVRTFTPLDQTPGEPGVESVKTGILRRLEVAGGSRLSRFHHDSGHQSQTVLEVIWMDQARSTLVFLGVAVAGTVRWGSPREQCKKSRYVSIYYEFTPGFYRRSSRNSGS